MGILLTQSLISARFKGYNIEYAALFDGSTGYLSWTPGAPTDNNVFTISVWLHRAELGVEHNIMYNTDGVIDQARLNYLSSGSFEWNDFNGSHQSRLISNQVSRDTAAFQHVVLVIDTDTGTATDRQKLYVNGERVTSFSAETTYSASSPSYGFNENGKLTFIGGQNFFDGYMAEFYFIDGQALTPSDFGETANNGNWVAKPYEGSYGSNGFYLDFSNASNLGEDQSGNGNDWTVNGTVTQVTSTPTNRSATWNPLDIYASAAPTLTDGNMRVDYTSAAVSWTCATVLIQKNTGKWSWKTKFNDTTSSTSVVRAGFCSANKKSSNEASIYTPSAGDSVWLEYSFGGVSAVQYCLAGVTQTDLGTWSSDPAAGDTYEWMIDTDNDTLTFINEDGTTVVNAGDISGMEYPFLIFASPYQHSNYELIVDFTPTDSAAKTLTTDNLPTPSGTGNIQDHMRILPYQSDGSSSVNVDTTDWLDPTSDDWVLWIKSRSDGGNHTLVDSARGVYKLEINATSAEALWTSWLSTSSTGFTLPYGNGDSNFSTSTFVPWIWKLPSSETNSDGDITVTWKYNAELGMAVGTYTGTGTAGHTLGLPMINGTAPKMHIVKCRSNADSWRIYHAGIASDAETDYLTFTTDAAIDDNTLWNDTAPTSSTITLGTQVSVNGASRTYVIYAFWETDYCKIGSYTGNGNTDGPFVNMGGLPEWYMSKRTDSSSDYVMWDAVRSPYNPTAIELFANNSLAEAAGVDLDLVSNGVKIRRNATNFNASGGTYIYLAFVQPNGPTENPGR